MNPNQQLIEQFYSAFKQRNWQRMQAYYHVESTFYDPVFRNLNCMETKAMWHMLCENASEFDLKFSNASADEHTGKCSWRASYLFSRTGRRVHNVIEATFEFKDGLIKSHQDAFDLWRWSRMAFGTTGLLLGWSSFFTNKVHHSAKQSLLKFIQKHPEYQKN